MASVTCLPTAEGPLSAFHPARPLFSCGVSFCRASLFTWFLRQDRRLLFVVAQDSKRVKWTHKVD